MTVAVIALSLGLAGALGVIALLVWKLTGASDIAIALNQSLVAQGKAQVETDRELQQVQSARDAALRAKAEAEERAAAALARLQSEQAIIDTLQKQGVQDAVNKIRNAATSDDALAALRELLAPLPGVSAAGDASNTAAGVAATPAGAVQLAARAATAKP